MPCFDRTVSHFAVLLSLPQGDQVYAINRVSGRVVAEVGFRSPLTKNVSGAPSRSIGECGVGCEHAAKPWSLAAHF